MALATQCPHCGKRFRVAADQLKLYGGIVRCGACHEIFDGNASLIDYDAPAAPSAPAPAAAPAVATSSATEPVVPAQDSASPRGTQGHAAAAAPAGTDAPDTAVVPAHAVTDAEAAPASVDASDPDFDGTPIYTLDFDHTFDPFGILPKPAQDEAGADDAPIEDALIEPGTESEPELDFGPQAESEPEPDSGPRPGAEPEPEPQRASEPEPDVEPAAQPAAVLAAEPAHQEPVADAPLHRVEPGLELPVDEELVAAPPPGHDEDDLALLDAAAVPAAAAGATAAPLPMREAAGTDFTSAAAQRPARPRVADARPGRRSKLTPTKISAPKLRAPEIDEPEFVRRSRQQEQSGKTMRILMAAGSLLLLLALAAQLAVSFRNVLAARYPAAKPALAATCKLFGCRVELPAQIENLVIETGELTTLGGSGSTYALTTLLRNQGGLVQAWPRIELALTDANDKPLLRRVFTPAEYLPPGPMAAAGFPARAEQPVKLYFQLDQLKPSGYHIAVFYP